MGNKVPIHIMCIVLLYLTFGAVLYLIPVSMLGPTGTQDQGAFMDLFHEYSLIVIGVSLMCMLTWYALGEWGIKHNAHDSTWYATWLSLLVVVLVTATILSFIGPMGGTTDPINFAVAPYYVGGGLLPYYIASVCLSPTHPKYLIWPARLIRSW